MERPKPKSCSFCGSAETRVCVRHDLYEEGDTLPSQVICPSCKMRGPVKDTGAEAITFWNQIDYLPISDE
jgi:hypothetical protein